MVICKKGMVMNKNQFPLLRDKDQLVLKEALHYMKVAELKKASHMFGLSDKGKKGQLIEQILTFINEGKITEISTIPAVSRAKNHPIQMLSPSSLMLHGSYKNDLKTRNFFKKLIGPQFHFTAFGIDWLNERWLNGCPPTYQEFADFWIQEQERHNREKPKPKDEWMLIRFMQKMKKEEPEASKEDLLHAWKQVQNAKKEQGFQLLKKAARTLKYPMGSNDYFANLK